MLSRSSSLIARCMSTVVYVDGSCLDNNRPNPRAGAGIYWGPDDPRNSCLELRNVVSSDRAELIAALYAVNQAEAEGIESLVIRTDSLYLVSSLNIWIHKWKVNNWKLKNNKTPKNLDILLDLDIKREKSKIDFEWVSGHSGHEGNEEAHKLAQKGASKRVSLVEDITKKLRPKPISYELRKTYMPHFKK